LGKRGWFGAGHLVVGVARRRVPTSLFGEWLAVYGGGAQIAG